MEKLEAVVAHLSQDTKRRFKIPCTEKASTIYTDSEALTQTYIVEYTDNEN